MLKYGEPPMFCARFVRIRLAAIASPVAVPDVIDVGGSQHYGPIMMRMPLLPGRIGLASPRMRILVLALIGIAAEAMLNFVRVDQLRRTLGISCTENANRRQQADLLTMTLKNLFI